MKCWPKSCYNISVTSQKYFQKDFKKPDRNILETFQLMLKVDQQKTFHEIILKTFLKFS